MYLQPETGYFSNAFDFCKAKCRTHSKSTVHENAYKSRFHHCFGEATAAGDAGAPAKKPEMDSLDVQAGEAGESCDQVRVKRRLTCLFATSLAPMPKASVKAITHAATNPSGVSPPMDYDTDVSERRGAVLKTHRWLPKSYPCEGRFKSLV